MDKSGQNSSIMFTTHQTRSGYFGFNENSGVLLSPKILEQAAEYEGSHVNLDGVTYSVANKCIVMEKSGVKTTSVPYTHGEVAKYSICVSGENVYMSGGKKNGMNYPYLHIFNHKTGIWSPNTVYIGNHFDHGSLVFQKNLILFGGVSDGLKDKKSAITYVALETMKCKTLESFDPICSFSIDESVWFFSKNQILLLQADLTFKIFEHNIAMDRMQNVGEYILVCWKKSHCLAGILDRELAELYKKPAPETVDQTIIIKHFQELLNQFPLIAQQKGKDVLLGIVPILRDIDRSFKFGFKGYLTVMISSIYTLILKLKNQATYPIHNSSFLSIIYDLGDPKQVMKVVKMCPTITQLPKSYQDAYHEILFNIFRIQYPDSAQIAKWRWYIRLISLLKPLTSIVNPQTLISKLVDLLFSSVGRQGTQLILEISKTESEVKQLQKDVYIDVSELVSIIDQYPCEEDKTVIEHHVESWKVRNGVSTESSFIVHEFIQVAIRLKEKRVFMKSMQDPQVYQMVKDFLTLLSPVFQVLSPAATSMLLNTSSWTISRLIAVFEKIQSSKDASVLWQEEVTKISVSLEKDLHEFIFELLQADPKTGKILEKTVGWIACLELLYREISIDQITEETILSAISKLIKI